MTGVTCVREDGTGDELMLSNKVTKGHLGQRRAEERSWVRTVPSGTVTLDPSGTVTLVPSGTETLDPSGTVTLDPSGTLAPGSAAGSVLVKKHHHKRSIKHRYHLLETLGRGTYGKVKKAVDKRTGTLVAVKSIQKAKITDELDRVHLQREIEISALLKHEHIIRVCEVFESSEKIIIVMEFASNGELYDFINGKHQIPESEARRFFRQIVSAVHYCHKNGIVHRDIKLENILLDENLNVKLADFGLSNLYHNKQVLETYCGSPLYASPEIVKGFPYHGPEVDCWALGVLLYALVYGSMPFDNCNYKTLAEQIGSGRYRQPPHLSGADGLIDWMLTVNPARRATIEDIANHWWVNWGYDVSVCDCHLLSECRSPLLARYIECQNMLGYNGTKTDLSRVLPREDEGCLRKSKKENDINQSQQELDVSAARKKPKGILKKRSSFDSSFLNSSNFSENCMELSQEAAPAYESHISTDAKCTFNKPKKGILKKTYERESGYSSSPERISECQKAAEGKGRSERYTQRKKGILKTNGRFSSSLDLPEDHSSLRLSDSMEDLVYPNADAAGSRPSSVISDDSFLSSDSFDLLDMSSETKSKLFYSSEEEETSWRKLRGTLYNPNHRL